MSRTSLGILILATYVILVNITTISSTVGWVLGAVAAALVLSDTPEAGRLFNRA